MVLDVLGIFFHCPPFSFISHYGKEAEQEEGKDHWQLHSHTPSPFTTSLSFPLMFFLPNLLSSLLSFSLKNFFFCLLSFLLSTFILLPNFPSYSIAKISCFFSKLNMKPRASITLRIIHSSENCSYFTPKVPLPCPPLTPQEIPNLCRLKGCLLPS